MTDYGQEQWIQYSLKINARRVFWEFIQAVEKEEGLIEKLSKIQKQIDEIVFKKEKEQFIIDLRPGKKLSRARIINPLDFNKTNMGLGRTADGKFCGYDAINSREPILGISGEGRNNIAGESYLYVASDEQTACMEVRSIFGDLISLATFEVSEVLKIVDFASDKRFEKRKSEECNMSLAEFFSLLMMQYTKPVKNKKVYRATQMISDYIRKTGIDGIAYKSFLTPGGVNYTIFNGHPSKIAFLDSRVVLHKQANHSFWDLNHESTILSNPQGKGLTYDLELANEQKQVLANIFKALPDKN